MAYAATATGRVVAVDITSGTVLSEVSLPEGVQDVALQAEYLYALTTKKLYALALQNNSLTLAGSADSPGQVGAGGRPWRLFVGGGLAYATHTQGYNTFDLTLPKQPVLLKAGQTQQFGWKQIVTNGAGVGVAAVGPNSTNDSQHNISLYDVRDPQQTDVFITEFDTPGLAAAVTIDKGRAYVADSEAGMQVINYLAYDNKKAPPTITLATNFAPGKAEEGAIMRITATTSDDVQVRNVEFYVDGKLVATDGSFPFEYRFITPRIADQPSFKLRARAVDTGGHETWTDEQTITLVLDATSPRVVGFGPTDATHPEDSVSTVTVTFNETMQTNTFTSQNFKLFSSGPDKKLGTNDDILMTGGSITYDANTKTAALTFSTPLPHDLYRISISSAVTDLAGNPLASDFSGSLGIGMPLSIDFSDLSKFTLNGAAASVNTPPVIVDGQPVLRLIESGLSSGSAFLSAPISLSNGGQALSFSTHFDFQVNEPSDGVVGGDGMTFAFVTNPTSLGDYGGYLGYSDIKPSLAVEFDTYDNGWDPDANHIGIDLNGELTSVVTQSFDKNVAKGTIWSMWIDYDGQAKLMEVRLATQNIRPATPLITYTVDLLGTLGQPNVYIGFTAGVAGVYGDYDVRFWEYNLSSPARLNN